MPWPGTGRGGCWKGGDEWVTSMFKEVALVVSFRWFFLDSIFIGKWEQLRKVLPGAVTADKAHPQPRTYLDPITMSAELCAFLKRRSFLLILRLLFIFNLFRLTFIRNDADSARPWGRSWPVSRGDRVKTFEWILFTSFTRNVRQ